MYLIHIAPMNCTKTLNSYSCQSMAMCLTHLVERNDEYRKFYARFRGYKILDNSLIELGGAVELPRVLSAAQEINAQEIILPDKFLDCQGTLEAVRESIQQLKNLGELGKYKLMAVAHGSTVEEWVHCFKELEAIKEIDVIGIPKVTAKLQPGGRPALESIWRNSHKQIHLLGLWYAFGELDSYMDPDRIRSVDTCQAAFLAKYHMDKWSVRPDGFTIDLEDTSIDPKEFCRIIQGVK